MRIDVRDRHLAAADAANLFRSPLTMGVKKSHV